MFQRAVLRPCLLVTGWLAVSGCSGETGAGAATGGEPAAPLPVAGAPLETRATNATGQQSAFRGQTRAPGVRSDIALDVQTVARGLDQPWGFELLPDGRFIVTERPGAMRIIAADGSISGALQGVPPVAYGGQGGLLDVALDPQFASNRLVYWSYSEPRSGGNGTSLARGRLVEDGGALRLEGVQVIFRQMPTVSSELHFGSRIAFTGDGRLFLSLGERFSGMAQAQDLRSHLGKLIRINPDGSVPADNPFVGRSDARPEIWSWGHRNIQAATVDAATGRIWTIEHGPRGGDELNQPKPGLNYGWPVITYGINYNGDPIGQGITAQEGMEQPLYYWDPVIAPSGMIVYQGSLFPAWKGSIFVGGLGSMKLVRLQLEGERVVGEEWLLQDRNMRIRDVREGPDGAIYVLGDGPNSALLRLVPRQG